MPIDERSISLPEQWAKDAQTVIPAPPVPGIAYRNTAVTPEQWAHGQDYSRVADSAQWNQMFWVMSGLLQSAEQYGVMPYSPFTDYPELGICMGADGQLYQALQPSGPNNGGAQPTNNTAFWKHAIVVPPATFIGDTRLLPFRADDLAEHCPGWHFCNGDQYAITSPVGAALNALPTNFKTDWGIVVTGDNISIPNMFYSDGRGLFLRAGTTPGTRVGDAIRNMTGDLAFFCGGAMHTYTGVFSSSYSSTWSRDNSQHLSNTNGIARFNASSQVPTAEENRPVHVTFTPAIFLNV